MSGPEKKKRPAPAFLFGKPRVVKSVAPEESPEARATREALEAAKARVEEEREARLAEIGAKWAHLGENIRTVIPSSVDYLQAYYLSLLRQGRSAEEQGRILVADHCRRRVETGLAGYSDTASGAASRFSGAVSSVTILSKQSASALTTLKSRWDVAARERIAMLLARHAGRLAPAEREAYAASLEVLSSPVHSSLPTSALPLRRKLVDRLLRTETYRRRSARFSGWTKTPVPENGPAGPYNDFVALEQTVQRIAAVHPEWAAEFLDLYGEMGKIRSAYQALLPGKK